MLWTCLREEYTCVHTFQIHNEIRDEGGIKGDDLSIHPSKSLLYLSRLLYFNYNHVLGKDHLNI